jgi:hypothetical protein
MNLPPSHCNCNVTHFVPTTIPLVPSPPLSSYHPCHLHSHTSINYYSSVYYHDDIHNTQLIASGVLVGHCFCIHSYQINHTNSSLLSTILHHKHHIISNYLCVPSTYVIYHMITNSIHICVCISTQVLLHYYSSYYYDYY